MQEDEAWGHWMAGLADGEGCFYLGVNKTAGWTARFTIALRADDHEVLEECARRFGGRFRYERTGQTRNAMCVWVVATRKECQRLVEVFRRYPLRAKKRSDFELWALAVEHLNQTHAGFGGHRTTRNQTYLLSLAEAIRAQRAFAVEPIAIAVPLDPQIRMAE